jgi:D-alanine transaminase
MDDEIVYINGEFVPVDQATVSVMDRGFLLADGIYDVIPIYYSKLFYAEEHFKRLFLNLEKTKILKPFDKEKFIEIIKHLIEVNPSHEVQGVYIQITRGKFARRVSYLPCEEPTVLIMLQPKTVKIDEVMDPVSTITVEDLRWRLCDIKGVNRFSNTLMSIDVYEKGAYEGIIVLDNIVREGLSSNIFIVEGDKVFTPPLSDNILNGVTRQAIIDILKAKFDFSEESITAARLLSADEVWISSSLRGVVSVAEVDGNLIGNIETADKISIVRDCYLSQIKKLKN